MDMNTRRVCHVWSYHRHEDWHWCLW